MDDDDVDVDDNGDDDHDGDNGARRQMEQHPWWQLGVGGWEKRGGSRIQPRIGERKARMEKLLIGSDNIHFEMNE